MSEMGRPRANAPDTFGLPEYVVSDVVCEIDGGNIRVVCGARRFGEIHWLYSVVVAAGTMLMIADECRRVSEEAFLAMQVMGQHMAH